MTDFTNTAGPDSFVGGTGDDNFLIPGGTFGAGADLFRGGDGSDTAVGGRGRDSLFGQAGNDALFGGGGPDRLFGGTGDDTFGGLSGRDRIFGGDGFDFATWSNQTRNITIDAAVGQVGTTRIAGIESFRTGTGFDQFFGSDLGEVVDVGTGASVIEMNGGDDTVYVDAYSLIGPARSNDTVSGGAGNDTITSFGGFDALFGGAGSADDLNLQGAGAMDMVISLRGRATVDLGLAGQLSLRGFERVTTGGGNDTLTGSRRDERFIGNDGDDIIKGKVGHDELYGGAGTDSLFGGKGADYLGGEGGSDAMFGGAGRDTFHFTLASDSAPLGDDTISDFETGVDTILLAGFRAGPADPPLTLTFIGEASFSGVAGEVQSRFGTFAIDADGGGAADLVVTLNGVTSLSEADFLFV